MPQKDWHDPLAGPNRSSVAALVGPAPRQFAIFELRTKKLLKNGDPRISPLNSHWNPMATAYVWSTSSQWVRPVLDHQEKEFFGDGLGESQVVPGGPRWYRVVPGVKGLLSNTVPSMTFEHSHFSITFEHSLLHHVRKRPSPTEIIDRRNTLKTRAFKSDAWWPEKSEKCPTEKFTAFIMYYKLIALTAFSPWKPLCHLACICLGGNILFTSSALFHTLATLYRLLLLSCLMHTVAI